MNVTHLMTLHDYLVKLTTHVATLLLRYVQKITITSVNTQSYYFYISTSVSLEHNAKFCLELYIM